MSRRLRRTIHDPSELPAARSAVRRWLRRWHSANWTDEVLLACGEAIDNAVEHGRLPIDLELENHDAVLTVVIRDRGRWRVSATRPALGLGMPIMTAVMDNLTIETTDGTTITLTRRFADEPAAISGGSDE